jgi:hypothetical protein
MASPNGSQIDTFNAVDTPHMQIASICASLIPPDRHLQDVGIESAVEPDGNGNEPTSALALLSGMARPQLLGLACFDLTVNASQIVTQCC